MNPKEKYQEAMQEMRNAETEDLRRYWSLVVDSLAWTLERSGLTYKQA